MMKRKILAVIVPAMLVAGAANAAEVYNKDGNKLDITGKIQGSHYFSDNDKQDGDKTYARFGLRGETQVSDQVVGYGYYQTELNASQQESGGNTQKTRLAYAGIKAGDAGSFDYGRNYGVLYDIGGWTDVLPEFGGETYQQTDVFMTQRAGNLATYRNKNFFGMVDGLNFAVQYQGRNDADDRNGSRDSAGNPNASDRNGDGWGLSSVYNLGNGLSLGAAYTSSDRTDEQTKDFRGDRADAVTGGFKYDANNIYFAAMYSQTYNMTKHGSAGPIANKAQNIEVVAQYMFDFGLQPSVAYLQSKGKDLAFAGYDSEDMMKYVDVGATYYFNKNISAKVDYKINLLDDNGFTDAAKINTDDVVAVGIVYQF